MGSDRDHSLPVGASTSKVNDGDMWAGSRGNKKSCYDRDICPLYCAWGVDVFDLFTNTKSDLGPNPYITQEDAREEFLSLPDHEKDRLGYEHMLHRKLGDLVRSCDRIVTRNKDKLRAEVAKAARARGADGNRIDPVTEVKDEVLLETAECMADLELREEEVAQMVEKLVQLDREWKESWKQVQVLRAGKNGETANNSDIKDTNQISMIENESTEVGGEKDDERNELVIEVNSETAATVTAVENVILNEHLTANTEDSANLVIKSGTEHHTGNEEKENKELKGKTEDSRIVNQGENSSLDMNVEVNGNEQLSTEKEESDKSQPDNTQTAGKEGTIKEKEETQSKGCAPSEKVEELLPKLYSISSEQQTLISSLTSITSQNIMPLRENLQGLQKQLYYIRTDTSSDKTVCEISGNFMSSRDAEERIAAHYAGKQYVGWKMVRDKFRELHLKYNSVGRGPQMMGGQNRGLPNGSRGGQPRGYGPPGVAHGPPPSNSGYGHGDRGPPMGYHHGPSARHNDRDHRDRSRSRDRDNYSSRSRGGGVRGGRQNSPPRWERDRHPHNHDNGSGRHGGRRDDRGHYRSRN